MSDVEEQAAPPPYTRVGLPIHETRVGNLTKNVKRTAIGLAFFALIRAGLTIPRVTDGDDDDPIDDSESTKASLVSLVVVVVFFVVMLPSLGIVGAVRLSECALMTYAVVCIVSSIRIFVATIAFIAQVIKESSGGPSTCFSLFVTVYITLNLNLTCRTVSVVLILLDAAMFVCQFLGSAYAFKLVSESPFSFGGRSIPTAPVLASGENSHSTESSEQREETRDPQRGT
eukprot:gb/GECG01001325.1/.p1 GENE.gb/GECG01001325.1/~~gb/GECG01001325.1/.p1  ORF type:complete len:229 (+),score=13.69 gb/GECG01001325.1/:1-687(+)